MFTGVSAVQMGLIHIMAGMMEAGVFERYPRLRVSFGESGAGWLAYALHRMDFEFEVDTPLARRLLLRSEPAVREDRGAGR